MANPTDPYETKTVADVWAEFNLLAAIGPTGAEVLGLKQL